MIKLNRASYFKTLRRGDWKAS